jgi:hypothetical protein
MNKYEEKDVKVEYNLLEEIGMSLTKYTPTSTYYREIGMSLRNRMTQINMTIGMMNDCHNILGLDCVVVVVWL